MSVGEANRSGGTLRDGDAARGTKGRRASPRQGSGLTSTSSVLALVPHYRCEEWLADCLDSLVRQTRPLDGIVVIDDASAVPPIDIVQRFPEVTLLVAEENSGPYRLVQQAINTTGYDAYLFADADDWSSPDRLERLLAEAERTGAELVGSQEIRILCDVAEATPFRFPRDVNAALRERPTSFPLLHPTSLVSRALVERIGGFASGMRFGGDAEFLRRAAYVARIVNVPQCCYSRRKRAGSLTMDPSTGLQSSSRRELIRILAARAHDNADAVARGEAPDLRPYREAPPVDLTHVAGPALRPPSALARRSSGFPSRWSKNGNRSARSVARPPRSPRPVFVIGSARSGKSLLAWSLAQHPGLFPRVEPGWLASLTRQLDTAYAQIVAGPAGSGLDALDVGPEDFYERMGRAIADLVVGGPARRGADGRPAARAAISTSGRWVASDANLALLVPSLVRLFPEARVVHVLRDVHEVVGSLLNVRLSKQDRSKHTLRSAVRHWEETAKACVAAERAYGSETVLRVRYPDWIEDPRATVGRCLAFVEELFVEECLRPTRRLELELAAADGSAAWARAEIPEDVQLLSRQLLLERRPAYPRDEGAIRALEDALREGAAGGPLTEENVTQTIRVDVQRVLPPDSRVVVVSRGDDELLEIVGRRCCHFPQTPDGRYAGHHPADSAEAIRHLERLRADGAQYLLFPSTAFWWLDYYLEFRKHLESRYRSWMPLTGSCLVFELAPSGRSRLEAVSRAEAQPRLVLQ